MTPTMPQAILLPEFPVIPESPLPLPKSSAFACTTTVLPRMELGPLREICPSVILTDAYPYASATIFPRSPTCRLFSLAVWPPCEYHPGLKCNPAEKQPSRRSPNSWTWNPWFCLGVRPWMVPLIVTPPPKLCVNSKTPWTPLASFPTFRTAKAFMKFDVGGRIVVVGQLYPGIQETGAGAACLPIDNPVFGSLFDPSSSHPPTLGWGAVAGVIIGDSVGFFLCWWETPTNNAIQSIRKKCSAIVV